MQGLDVAEVVHEVEVPGLKRQVRVEEVNITRPHPKPEGRAEGRDGRQAHDQADQEPRMAQDESLSMGASFEHRTIGWIWNAIP